MSMTRSNPMGLALPEGVIPVRVGKYGKLVHCYVPEGEDHPAGILCKSGTGRSAKKQPLYNSKANFITCYRCNKLMLMNLEAGRKAWQK